MNLKIFLLALSAIAMSSCSTIYKNGQTPDDVYYSPSRAATDVSQNKKEETYTPRRQYADRQIVMGIYDPRWRYFEDDYDYRYDPYHYGYTYGYYYNPYYYPSPVYISGASFVNPKNTTPRMTNLGSYNYSNMVVVNQKPGSTTLIRSARAYNNTNTTQTNNFIRRIITPVFNPRTNNNTYQPAENSTRTYTPSTNSNSSSSGSSGTPVARPRRG